jgi:ABC-type antimicrobial peptide transport system permease subunit
LWKYKSQTLISVIGLATGFACFAMATLWIRYEMTYDSFHKNADRIYRVGIKDKLLLDSDGMTVEIEFPLHLYLKKTFPEIRNAVKVGAWREAALEIDGTISKTSAVMTDSTFLKMFDIKILAGNSDFMIYENKQVALTQAKAAQLFGNENPVGKTLKLQCPRGEMHEYTVGATVSGYSAHSNYPFEILGACDRYMAVEAKEVLVELAPGISVESFRKRLYEHKATIDYRLSTMFTQGVGNGLHSFTGDMEKTVLSPLTTMHYKDTHVGRTVKFEHIIIFAVAGLLLILCTLFNYLALFVNRFRIRMREFALRTVCGASNSSLFMLLSVEFLMPLVISLSFGSCLIDLIIRPFRTLSGVDIEMSFIYVESLTYIGIIIAVSLLTFLLALYLFRRRALNLSIRNKNSRVFRKISIVAQLVISIVFAFCTVIILKQMYHVHNTDLGFTFRNRGAVNCRSIDENVLENELKQIPEIEKTAVGTPIFFYDFSDEMYDWDGRPKDAEPVNMHLMRITEKYANLYGLKVVAGEMLNDSDSDEYIMINEAAAKVFGWKNPAGQTLTVNRWRNSTGQFPETGSKQYTVKGVIKDMHRYSFTESAVPTVFKPDREQYHMYALFECREGTWETCCAKIKQAMKEKYGILEDRVFILKEEPRYGRLLKSENVLLRILTVISLVCVTVCVFGFVSTVSLTCEERRREIAIRKINGATVKDILDIFFKEYLTLLAVGALTAFPAGYVIMKRWLENYVVRTEISAWVYVSILLVLLMTVILCVGGKVYRTSRENPIEAIKS